MVSTTKVHQLQWLMFVLSSNSQKLQNENFGGNILVGSLSMQLNCATLQPGGDSHPLKTCDNYLFFSLCSYAKLNASWSTVHGYRKQNTSSAFRVLQFLHRWRIKNMPVELQLQ